MSKVTNDGEPSRFRLNLPTIINASVCIVITGLGLVGEYSLKSGALDELLTALLGLAGFFIAEMAIFIAKAGHLEWVVEDEVRQMKQLIIDSNLHRDLMNNLAQIFSFTSEKEHAHHSAQKAIAEVVSWVKPTSDEITIKGELLSRKTYENFWRCLISAQARRPKNARQLSVYATHAASFELWRSPECRSTKLLNRGNRL